MAVNIHLRAVEKDFEVTEKVAPPKVDLTAVNVRGNNKGLLKLSLSITYFFVLVFFLVKLLT